MLVVVPARGGSKGIIKKNLRKIHGLSLTGLACRFASCDLKASHILCTSDSPQILNEASAYGATLLRDRPSQLAGDSVGDLPVLQDALNYAERKLHLAFSSVLMLQPTAPIRNRSTFEAAISEYREIDCDAMWSVTCVDPKYHPLKTIAMDDSNSGTLHPLADTITARQQLNTPVIRNGIFYIVKRRALLNGSMSGEKLYCYTINHEHVNIDTLKDLYKARRLCKKYADI